MSLHHALDVEPVSEKALYVHESDLADPSQADVPVASKAQGKPLDRRERLQLELRSQPEDNVRVYIPLDINEDAILRRLHHIFWKYGEVSEANEAPFRSEVETLVSQVEIYDQVWFVRDGDNLSHLLPCVAGVNQSFASEHTSPVGGLFFQCTRGIILSKS